MEAGNKDKLIFMSVGDEGREIIEIEEHEIFHQERKHVG